MGTPGYFPCCQGPRLDFCNLTLLMLCHQLLPRCGCSTFAWMAPRMAVSSQSLNQHQEARWKSSLSLPNREDRAHIAPSLSPNPTPTPGVEAAGFPLPFPLVWTPCLTFSFLQEWHHHSLMPETEWQMSCLRLFFTGKRMISWSNIFKLLFLLQIV